jgi:UDP-N-acetylglucosamine:LPS N-acetylglucosamine transferase
MHPEFLSAMSENMKKMSVPDAAGRVADLVERVAMECKVNG